MPRIVDGDNVLGSWPGRSRSDDDKRALVRLTRALSRREKSRIVVVFDGPSPGGVAEGPDVAFAGAGRSADELILGRLAAEVDPRGFTVVTHDRSLADRCRHLGARVESPKDFRGRLAPPGGPEKPEGPVDVREWESWFEDPGST